VTIDEKLQPIKEIWVDNFNHSNLKRVSELGCQYPVFVDNNYYYFEIGNATFYDDHAIFVLHFFRGKLYQDRLWNVQRIKNSALYIEGKLEMYQSHLSTIFYNKGNIVIYYSESGIKIDTKPIVRIRKELIE